MESSTTKSLSQGTQMIPVAASVPQISHGLVCRNGSTKISQLIDAYMAAYKGRDETRGQRMEWWHMEIGHLPLDEVDQDTIYFALQNLQARKPRYFAGYDADGKTIYKAKSKPYAPATINRYAATIGALFTWCFNNRLTPKGWVHPCRGIERKPEENERTRFLSKSECTSLLEACKASIWPKLYLLVIMALVTGGRKSELLRLKWSDINWERKEASVLKTKNDAPKVMPLTDRVIDEMTKFRGKKDALIFHSERCPKQPYNFVPAWSKALQTAEIKLFRFHDLRHTCASYLAQEGASLIQIGEVLGQKQVSVTKRYSHLATAHKSKLVNSVLGGIS